MSGDGGQRGRTRAKSGLADGFTALTIGAFGKPQGDEAGNEDAATGERTAEAAKTSPAASRAASPRPTLDPAREPLDAATPHPPSRSEGPDVFGLPPLAARPSLAPSTEEAVGKLRPEPDHRLGHRERLRARLREGGADAVADYELIEMVLFRALPRRDTKPLAKALVKEFGSLAGAINAPESRLRQIKGVGDAVVSELRLMGAVSRAVLRHAIEERPVLSSWEAVLDYARAHIAHSNVEHFHVLFLDKKNRLIRDEIQQTGTVDHTPVYPREVVRRAIELDATALILVHNHPSGDTTPSRADVAMTKTVIDVAAPLGITVHDHVVVGRHGHASMKGLGLI